MRAPIDACILRVNKHLQHCGRKILYGENSFFIKSLIHDGHSCPPTMIPCGSPKKLDVFRPYSRKPPYTEILCLKLAIAEIEKHVALSDLQGWVYYDHFLRFLYAVGSTNAAAIKYLKFCGRVKLHQCARYNCKYDSKDCRASENIVDTLMVHIQFIVYFCPNVDTLELCIGIDIEYHYSNDATPSGSLEAQKDEAEAFRLVFEELKKISKLQHLIVRNWDEASQHMPWAQGAVKWFVDRANRRTRSARLIAFMGSSGCNFCGEDHIWAECHNLCACGDFGVLRSACTKCTDDLDL